MAAIRGKMHRTSMGFGRMNGLVMGDAEARESDQSVIFYLVNDAWL